MTSQDRIDHITFFIDSSGDRITRQEFLQEMSDGWPGFVIAEAFGNFCRLAAVVVDDNVQGDAFEAWCEFMERNAWEDDAYDDIQSITLWEDFMA